MGVLDRFSLQGRVVLVTAGAGPLFGRSISVGLAEAGATVVTASRSKERNEQFAVEMRQLGHDVHGLVFDQEDLASIDALHDQIQSRFGRLDVLVNSALALDGHVGVFEKQTPETWDHAAKGDFAGLFRQCQRAVEIMKKEGRGSIINIASIYGVV